MTNLGWNNDDLSVPSFDYLREGAMSEKIEACPAGHEGDASLQAVDGGRRYRIVCPCTWEGPICRTPAAAINAWNHLPQLTASLQAQLAAERSRGDSWEKTANQAGDEIARLTSDNEELREIHKREVEYLRA